MVYFSDIQTTGVYRNEATQCYEAWFVEPGSGNRLLVATCSVCVAEEQVRWWEHQVWDHWLPQAGFERPMSRVA
ncbi:MAG: hypothetical protein WDA75_19655 [Candidatus Latescibacterota bacterium]